MNIKRITAFAAIYLLWGGAYLAVRVLVHTVPPAMAAGARYSLAGICMTAIMLAQRAPAPSRRQAINAMWTGALMLSIGYGVVFWVERRMPSWLVAVLGSTVFLWTYLGECFVLRTVRFRAAMLAPLLLGLAGMPLLVSDGEFHGSVSLPYAVIVLAGSLCWAAGSLAVKSIDMPRSPVQAAAIQSGTAGILLLCLSLALGERTGAAAAAQLFAWQPAAAMAYLVLGASVLALVAFLWLLQHEPASLVATSEYVNPIVAMLLGIVAAHERASPLEIAGALAVLASVLAVWRLQIQEERFDSVALSEMREP